MKKILAVSSAFVLAVVLTVGLMSFTDDNPKKQKSESKCTTECKKDCKEGKETKGSCCEKQCNKESGKCAHETEQQKDSK